MTNRRDFLKMSSMMVAGGILGSQLLTSCGGSKPTKAMGLQLYSLREPIVDLGIQEVLKQVAKMGYTTLELASYNETDGTMYGLKPAELKSMVEDLGMKITSSHVGGGEVFPMDFWKKAADDHAKCGCKYLVVPIMQFDKEGTMDLVTKTDTIKAYCEYLENAGMNIVTAGMVKIGYHNHWYEFAPIKQGETDQLIYDFMLQNTSASHVFFENDVFWTKYNNELTPNGTKVEDYINKYPDRFPLLHIKDEKEIGKSGLMDYKTIFDTAYAHGLKEFYVEVENYINPDPMVGIKESYDYLAQQEYVK